MGFHHVSADDVVINMPNPAWVRGADLSREASGPVRVGMALVGLLGRTPEVGASCLVDGLVTQGKESHGCFVMSWKINPFPSLMYRPDGEKLINKVWTEMVAELHFADLDGILQSMRS